MEKIASFTIDHIKLQPGVYVSRKDRIGAETVTTFDLRMTSPNEEPVMNTAEMHAIEHLGPLIFETTRVRRKNRLLRPHGLPHRILSSDSRRLYLRRDSASGDPHLRVHPGLSGRNSRSFRQRLRQLSGYESEHGPLSGRTVSGSGAAAYHPRTGWCIPAKNRTAPARAGAGSHSCIFCGSVRVSVGIFALPVPGIRAHFFNAVLGFPAQLFFCLVTFGVADGNISRTAALDFVGQFMPQAFSKA